MEKAIEKVFAFYSKQQSLLGKSPTFDMIQNNVNTLTKGKFLKFCNDFEILLERKELMSIFNKSTNFFQEMNLAQFKNSLDQLKGSKSLQEYCSDLGLDNLRICMDKCKPFSKKSTLSLSKLPLISKSGRKTDRVKIVSMIPISASTSHQTKITTGSKKSMGSNLPAAAISVPSYKDRGNSYHSLFKQKKKIFRRWDEVNRIECHKMKML